VAARRLRAGSTRQIGPPGDRTHIPASPALTASAGPGSGIVATTRLPPGSTRVSRCGPRLRSAPQQTAHTPAATPGAAIGADPVGTASRATTSAVRVHPQQLPAGGGPHRPGAGGHGGDRPPVEDKAGHTPALTETVKLC
jgi:hypothetical protein